MADILFFVKTLIYSVVIVVLLRAKLGETTIEDKILNWTQKAGFSRHIEESAQGLIKVTNDQIKKFKGSPKGEQ